MPIRLGLLGFLVATVCGFGTTVPRAVPCDCAPPPPPKEALAKASAVFLAKVVQIDDQPGITRRVTLDVERWWKGGTAPTLTVSTAKNSAICGYGFQKGERYLVYAHTDGQQGGQLWVSLCSRTAPQAQAQKSGDFKELGEGTLPGKK